jgi:hypothetical protein
LVALLGKGLGRALPWTGRVFWFKFLVVAAFGSCVVEGELA